jgi:cytochrome c oxidase subunit 3
MAESHAHHFPDAAVQRHAALFGMWLFLSTEVLLFAGLFVAYGYYRFLYPEAFAEGSRAMHTWMGLANTVVLIASSFAVALAHQAAGAGRNRAAFWLLAAALCAGVFFLGVKAVEYVEHFRAGELPGKWFAHPEMKAPGISLFYAVYFLATGLHALHVVVGMSLLAWAAVPAWKGRYGPGNFTLVENAGLYWHLVDLVWIFLFPLLYLV